MAYSGTIVSGGRLSGVVVATGAKSEIGRISEMVSQVEELQTPLLRKIDAFGRTLSVVIVAICLMIFAVGHWWRGLPPVDTFMAVISLVVAAIPEGLPAILTITLALGVQRMAKRNALVRKLPAVETLGSVTVICADKTGTLTRNEMTVTKVAIVDKIYSIAVKPDREFCMHTKNQELLPGPVGPHGRRTPTRGHAAKARVLRLAIAVHARKPGRRRRVRPGRGACPGLETRG